MTLSDCSKADLKWVIQRLLSKYCFSSERSALASVLADLEYEKEMTRLYEADKQAGLAHSKRMEYYNLMDKYRGKPLADIPRNVLKQGVQLLKEAEEADSKWEKLSGFKRTTCVKREESQC